MNAPARPFQLLLAATGIVLVFSSACQQTSGHTARPDISIPVPPTTADKAVQLAGLHNVVTYAPDLVCGGVPEGEEGLHTLAAMGIRTIISVDGATPLVATAERLGMRYVHLPISYDCVTPKRQHELAQAIHTLPGPLYLHCHHGKHRSGAALATALVLAGVMTPEMAMQRMGVSGTAQEYAGLWKAVQEAKPLDAAQLKADPASFPSISKVSGMVATMAEIDMVFDLVKQAQKAAWSAPQDHPDLVAAKETSRLHTLFSQLPADPDSKQLPADYQGKLLQMIETTKALDAAVQANDAATANRLFELAGNSCKACHTSYRDKQ